jgi:tetratricopeptide (TPR) repeat protein
MGIVYEAEQVSLGRRVALKVLPLAATLGGTQLQRFQNEARAAAGLHHTNIVPVYYVGCERGVHFYAMQFIDGLSLAAVLAQLRRPADPAPPAGREAKGAASTPPVALLSTASGARGRDYFRAVAEMGVQAAEALDYGHRVGVVHRDVKPANLLLDESGRLWVTDFGLAQVQGGESLTATGELVGTLRYMSPEQALGQRVVIDHRSDVYSLGASLYELLTLRPPFGGSDRQELLRQIAFEEPTAPRRLDRAVPPELETVVLKAMEKAPPDRYATAQELANDLRHWLEDRPIQARRPTLARRLTKWARRHKAVVAVSSGMAAVALVVIFLGLLWHGAQLRAAAQRERELREDAVAKRNLARRVVDRMYSQVAEKLLQQEPRQTPLQREFLEEALRLYQELAREAGDDQAVRFDVASACQRMGSLHDTLGRHKEAEEALDKAVAMLELLVEEFPAQAEYRQELLRTYWDLAASLAGTGRAKDGEAVTRKAIQIGEQLVAELPDDPVNQDLLAGHYNILGGCLSGLVGGGARPREAEQAFRQALRLREKLAAASPDKPDYRHTLGVTLGNLALLLMSQRGDGKEVRQLAKRAVEEDEAAHKLDPRHPRYRSSLCTGLGTLAMQLGGSGEVGEAVKLLRRAVDVREKLVADWPDVHRYHRDLADDYWTLARLLADRDPREAESVVLRAIAIQEQLTRDHPQIAVYRAMLTEMQLILGLARYRAGDWPGALTALQKADDEDASCRLFLALTHWQLGHKDEARDWYRKAVTWMEEKQPNDEGLRRLRAEAEALLGGKKAPQSPPGPPTKQPEGGAREGPKQRPSPP